MKILYVSALSSPKILDFLYKTSKKKPIYSIQKFHRLVVEGLVKNGCWVDVISSIPVSPESHSKKIFFFKNENLNGTHYVYLPFLNFKFVRQLCLFFLSFFYTLFWGIRNKEKKRVICDVLNISVCLGTLLACKFLRLNITGIMTDMPGLMVSGDKGLIHKCIVVINKCILAFFDRYIFLTEQMNTVVNIKQRPYIIMEGLVDINMTQLKKSESLASYRNIIYAGGLYERYGIKMLLEAFMELSMKDLRLQIYGRGPMEKDLPLYVNQDKRIHFYGVVPNEQVVDEELKATLLVNPRPTHEEFTKYSFPSKNMEYMVSGTPLLTTNLPGMPEEYHSYVYLFNEETTEGYKQKLEEVLGFSDQELRQKGKLAKQFVLEKKNNVVQAGRIIELIKQ